MPMPLLHTPAPVRTPRLRLHLLRPFQWRAIGYLDADFRASAFWAYDAHFPAEPAKLRAVTKYLAQTGLFYGVYRTGRPQMIGYVCFHQNGDMFDIGYRFHSSAHGRGYGEEACRAAMAHIINTRNPAGFTAGTAMANTPSVRLLAKLGFALQEKELIAFHKNPDGSPLVFEGGLFQLSLR